MTRCQILQLLLILEHFWELLGVQMLFVSHLVFVDVASDDLFQVFLPNGPKHGSRKRPLGVDLDAKTLQESLRNACTALAESIIYFATIWDAITVDLAWILVQKVKEFSLISMLILSYILVYIYIYIYIYKIA